MEEKKKTNKKFILIISALLLVGVVYGGYKYIHSLSHESTEDALIQANMIPVIPHVSGYLTKVFVSDNEKVQKGDTLFIIDPRDYEVELEKAKANLLVAKSQLSVAEASIGTSKAKVAVSIARVSSAAENIESAKINLERASDDFKRYKNLYENHSITTQQFEEARAAMRKAKNGLQILKSQKIATASSSDAAVSQTAISKKKIAVAQANIQIAKAQLDAAQLKIGYTVVTAPIDGQLSSVGLLPGQFVSPGQSLFYLVNTETKWVVANFKETQLTDIELGQKVTIEVDAYPNMKFEGKVTAFSPATGARFSLLPPNNATGNFVKTVQRLPIKITFTKNNDPKKLKKLRSGMNVVADVHLN